MKGFRANYNTVNFRDIPHIHHNLTIAYGWHVLFHAKSRQRQQAATSLDQFLQIPDDTLSVVKVAFF